MAVFRLKWKARDFIKTHKAVLGKESGFSSDRVDIMIRFLPKGWLFAWQARENMSAEKTFCCVCARALTRRGIVFYTESIDFVEYNSV